jgi:hypothetical protein
MIFFSFLAVMRVWFQAAVYIMLYVSFPARRMISSKQQGLWGHIEKSSIKNL